MAGGSGPTRSAVTTVVATASALGLAPGVASAHGVPTRQFEAPLPLELLLGAAAATVAVTALWLGISGRAPPATAEDGNRGRVIGRVPPRLRRLVRGAAAAGFLAVLVLAVADGVAGRQAVGENVATVFTWPVWFRGLAVVAILVGSPWRTLSPWRTFYRGLVRLEGKPIALRGRPPGWIGAWPALLGFLALLGVIEIATVIPRSPRLTVGVVAVYGLAMVLGAVLYGEAWFRAADPLGAFYRLLGRVSPVAVDGDASGGARVGLRAPWQGCLPPVAGTSMAALAVAAVYTVSFDGFARTPLFRAVLFGVRDALGIGPSVVILLYALGLGGFLVAFALTSAAVELLGTDSPEDLSGVLLGLAPTLVPIAAGYELAHNYPYVLANAARLIELLLEPLVGTVGPLDPLAALSVPMYWASQVVLIVGGHVVAVVTAHYVATDRYGAGAPRRAHLPLVALMIAYTVISLWLVSRPAAV